MKLVLVIKGGLWVGVLNNWRFLTSSWGLPQTRRFAPLSKLVPDTGSKRHAPEGLAGRHCVSLDAGTLRWRNGATS
jgi:hypothetical protein